jgi:succinate dehydrogenase / fumarate reductase, membrane anchor subunit
MKKNYLRNPLANARGLGSAKEGTHHFIMQRLTALALIPLTIWLIASLIGVVASGERSQLIAFLSSGINVAIFIALLLALFYHAKLGIQVIIEDYIHCNCVKIAALVINAFVLFAFALLSILSVLKIHFM